MIFSSQTERLKQICSVDQDTLQFLCIISIGVQTVANGVSNLLHSHETIGGQIDTLQKNSKYREYGTQTPYTSYF